MTALELSWGAASDTGLVRTNNEDSAIADADLFAVADGMGGHAAGEVASRVAIETLRASAATDGLVEAVRLANRAVFERAGTDETMRGMGTTMCALARSAESENQVDVVNVGDSRVYLFRDGDLQQVTEDHNLVSELEREGRLTAAEARVHPRRNIVTRVLGSEADVEVDLFSIDAFRGDRFLLCSDGLFDEVDDDGIADVLRDERDPEAAAAALVARARQEGGRDNITVVVVDVLADGDQAKRASASLGGAAPKQKAAAGTYIATTEEPVGGAGERTVTGTFQPEEPAPRRRLTWRSALFLLAVLAVVGFAVGATVWFARNTYYVGVDDDQVAIFRGRPGGVLWLEPTLEEETDLTLDDVPPARRADVEAGREQPSLARARQYVANLEQQAEEEGAATTTTTSTTTTVPGAPATP